MYKRIDIPFDFLMQMLFQSRAEYISVPILELPINTKIARVNLDPSHLFVVVILHNEAWDKIPGNAYVPTINLDWSKLQIETIEGKRYLHMVNEIIYSCPCGYRGTMFHDILDMKKCIFCNKPLEEEKPVEPVPIPIDEPEPLEEIEPISDGDTDELPIMDSSGGEKLCPKCKKVMPYYVYKCEGCGYAWD